MSIIQYLFLILLFTYLARNVSNKRLIVTYDIIRAYSLTCLFLTENPVWAENEPGGAKLNGEQRQLCIITHMYV